MARSIEQIKTSIAEAFMQDTNLAIKYGFEVGADFNQTFSKVSIENLMLYIVAASIWTLEKLFDTHTKEVTDYIATMKPHSLRWYVEKAKAFMYGVPLINGTDQHNTEGMTDEQINQAKIVTFAACTEANATLYLKVAKAGPAPLFNGEFRKNELEDAIQAVEGVVMVELGVVEHSETGSDGTFEEVIPYCKPTSGYFKFDHADLSGVTYQPYAH